MSKVYASNEPFPGNLYSVVSTQFLCGYKILILNLYPVQYIPALGKVAYYEDMKVIVAHAPAGSPGLERAKCRGLREDRARVERLVDNPAVVHTYTAEVTSTELANWEAEKKGLTTHVETVENILNNSTYTGDDDQETLRNFIREAYDQSVLYVVLGGDADESKAKKWGPIIPYRGVYGYVEGSAAGGSLGIYEDDDIPSDMYYGALDGSWDNNGNGIYGEHNDGLNGGEVDLLAEVFVGRIPADNATEALNHINKIIEYESSPHTASVLLVGRKADDITWGGDYKDEVYIHFPGWDAISLYDKDGTYSQTALINEMNSNNHHIVNYCSHSGYTNDMGLSNAQIAGLRNTKYFLAYSQGCMAGGFDSGTRPRDDCAGEHFTVENGDGGAFAYIGNTRYGWYWPGKAPLGPSQLFDEAIFDAIFNKSTTNEDMMKVGVALQDSKEVNIGHVKQTGAVRWCYFELCLLGDPETPVSEEPVVLPVADFVGDPTSGDSPLTVQFTDLSAGDVTSWSWDFDGDAVVDSSVQNPPLYTYNEPGIYTVRLEVGSSSNGLDIETKVDYITVTGAGGKVIVSKIDPSSMPVGSMGTVTITGSGFDDSPGVAVTVTFENGDGPSPRASDVVVSDSSNITATVTTKGGGPPHGDHVWDVRVTNPDNSTGVLMDGFTAGTAAAPALAMECLYHFN